MHEIFKSVIESGKYELTDMLKKIDVQWISGSITDEQRLGLIELARGKADTGNSVDVLKKLTELERRMQIVEAAVFPAESETPSEDDEIIQKYPGYVVGKWYYAGDIVTFDGAVYTCIAPDGVTCVWSPADYPSYWEARNEETVTV